MSLMDDMVTYAARWHAVEQIEQEELRTISIEMKWRQLNSIIYLAIELNIFRPDPSEDLVYQRWTKLKDLAKERD